MGGFALFGIRLRTPRDAALFERNSVSKFANEKRIAVYHPRTTGSVVLKADIKGVSLLRHGTRI